MSKKDNMAIVPKYRFPEFVDSWEIKPFKKYIKLYRGSSPRPIKDYITKNEGINWIKISDASNSNNFYITNVAEQITEEGAKKSRLVEKGELILANSMSFGATYEVGVSGCIYDGWFVLRKYEGSFVKQFLLQQLNTFEQQKQYSKLSAGGVVKNISSDIVYETILKRPSKKEQQKIADCLSSIDDLISDEEKKVSLLNDYKKGWMEKLFPAEGKTVPEWRFPEFQDSVEWEKIPLGQISLITTGKLDANAMVEDGKYRFYTCAKEFFKIDKYAFDAEALLISGNGANVGYIHYYKGKFNAYQRTYILHEFKKNICYVKYFLEGHLSRRIAKEKNAGNTPYILRGTLSEMEIIIPEERAEQEKIAKFLSGIDDLISTQTDRIEALKQHKKALMQGLFPVVEEVLK